MKNEGVYLDGTFSFLLGGGKILKKLRFIFGAFIDPVDFPSCILRFFVGNCFQAILSTRIRSLLNLLPALSGIFFRKFIFAEASIEIFSAKISRYVQVDPQDRDLLRV